MNGDYSLRAFLAHALGVLVSCAVGYILCLVMEPLVRLVPSVNLAVIHFSSRWLKVLAIGVLAFPLCAAYRGYVAWLAKIGWLEPRPKS